MTNPLISPAQLYPAGAGRPSYSLIDVRAPVETSRGALPGAACLPLMTDEERHLVGVRYKEAGQEAAIRLGYELVGPTLSKRTEGWRRAAGGGPAAVACWRGGLRSKLVCDFMGMPEVSRVQGGYKAIRAYLVGQLGERLARLDGIVIGGLTGSGKTSLLQKLARTRPGLLALDLEEAAQHRGSAFGWRGEQPSQATFENRLALALTLASASVLLLEDESRQVGRCALPDQVMDAIRRGPLVLVVETIESRIATIFREYVQAASSRVGTIAAKDFFAAGLGRLKRRLGGTELERCLAALEDAWQTGAWGESAAHAPWIRVLLERYYDPLYQKSLDKLARPVLFTGSREECYAWMTRTPQPFA